MNKPNRKCQKRNSNLKTQQIVNKSSKTSRKYLKASESTQKYKSNENKNNVCCTFLGGGGVKASQWTAGYCQESGTYIGGHISNPTHRIAQKRISRTPYKKGSIYFYITATNTRLPSSAGAALAYSLFRKVNHHSSY